MCNIVNITVIAKITYITEKLNHSYYSSALNDLNNGVRNLQYITYTKFAWYDTYYRNYRIFGNLLKVSCIKPILQIFKEIWVVV